MSISPSEQQLENLRLNIATSGPGGDPDSFFQWTTLKFQMLEESLSVEAGEAKEELERRFAELAAEIDQLRLQVQPNKPFFFYNSRDTLPTLNGASIKEVYTFFTSLEREFKLRNYELRLPASNTDGWTHYALMRLAGTAVNWATTKWGIAPNISWETFKKAMVSGFITDTTVRQLSTGYVGLSVTSSGDIRTFNDSFREFRLLLDFVGKSVDEKAAIRDYEDKIKLNKKVALAFAQFMTVERIVERTSAVSLAEIMKYCENVDSI